MSEATQEIIRKLPRWVFIAAFCVFVVFMVISLFTGTFKMGSYEFGFSPKSKDSVDEDLAYRIIGSVETSDQKDVYEIVISTAYPPVKPSAEGTIVGLNVWKGPNGKFPTLGFTHGNYAPVGIDLNDPDKVVIDKDSLTITIKKPIKMLRNVK